MKVTVKGRTYLIVRGDGTCRGCEGSRGANSGGILCGTLFKTRVEAKLDANIPWCSETKEIFIPDTPDNRVRYAIYRLTKEK